MILLNKILLPTCHWWQQSVHSDYGKYATTLQNCITYTVSKLLILWIFNNYLLCYKNIRHNLPQDVQRKQDVWYSWPDAWHASDILWIISPHAWQTTSQQPQSSACLQVDARHSDNKKLSYRQGTARCVLSVVILPVATQQCRNYLYNKSWPNRWY